MKYSPLFSIAACCLSALALCATLLQEPAEPVLIESAPIADRVMELPEDGGRWSTIVVYPDGAKDVESRAMASWFATNPQLQSLRAQTRFFEFKQSDWWPRYYMASVPAPFVIMLDETNRVIYHADRGNLPGDDAALADEIQVRIADCCPEIPSNTVPQPEPQREWQSKRKIPLLRPTEPSGGDFLQSLAIVAAMGGAAWFGLRSRG